MPVKQERMKLTKMGMNDTHKIQMLYVKRILLCVSSLSKKFRGALGSIDMFLHGMFGISLHIILYV